MTYADLLLAAHEPRAVEVVAAVEIAKLEVAVAIGIEAAMAAEIEALVDSPGPDIAAGYGGLQV